MPDTENTLPNEAPQPENTSTIIVPKKSPIKIIIIVLATTLLIGGLAFAVVRYLPKKTLQTDPFTEDTGQSIPSPAVFEGKFAQYKEMAVSFTPKAVESKPNESFSNVENLSDFKWVISEEDNKKKLSQNGFIVFNSWEDEFFPLYESNRYGFTPSFVTTDSIIHSYHLLFNSLLEKLEKNKLDQITKELTAEMVKTSQNNYDRLKGTNFENAAKRNIAFFAVAARLLDDNFQIPDLVKDPVEAELKLIANHQGIANSPVINLGSSEGGTELLKEDYTQYIPRGHYDKTDQLKKYFKAMMWYGRMTFRFKSDDEIKSAMLINFSLSNNQTALSKWQTIDDVIKFFVGKSDDIDYSSFDGEMVKVYGKSSDVERLLDESKFTDLKSKLVLLSPPAINSIPIFQSDIQPDREKEIKGFRFMGQKFTVDASIFQKLVCRDVGNKHGTMDCGGTVSDSRMLPKGLDIPAAFGSEEAYSILKSAGETEYKKYPENMQALKTYLSNVTVPIWTQNLYWGWMYSLKPLTEKRDANYPYFMQGNSWLRKQLNTFLGSWTELKHDTILYAKQVMAEMGGGPPEEKDDRGYVEPEPVFYTRLAALTRMTNDGLSSRNLIEEGDKEILKIMEDLCLSLKTISEKELEAKSLTKEEYELIRGYGGSLEHLYMKAMEDSCKEKSAGQCLDDNPAALVADVATDPNGQVLEEATGKIHSIYVVVSVEGKLKLTKGGVFSYYEFPWPMNDRLTDTKWREILSGQGGQTVPPLPSWTEIYRGKQ